MRGGTVYIARVAAAFSQLGNALLGGHNNMTISARVYVHSRLHGGGWERVRRVVDGVFFWQQGHCRRSWHADVEWSVDVVQLDRMIDLVDPERR